MVSPTDGCAIPAFAHGPGDVRDVLNSGPFVAVYHCGCRRGFGAVDVDRITLTCPEHPSSLLSHCDFEATLTIERPRRQYVLLAPANQE